MKPGAGQGSPLRVAPLYSAILVKIITCLGPSCPTSRAPHHGQCLLAGPVDAEEWAGVEIVLGRAVPNVAAGVGPCGDGNRLSNSVKKRQAMAGSGLEAAAVVGGSAVEGRVFVIMLDKFCSPASILGGASDSVRRRCTRWRASCALLCCAQRQVPTVLSFLPGCGCCSTLTRWSMSWERGCSMEACERISHIFFVLLALFAWNLDLIS